MNNSINHPSSAGFSTPINTNSVQLLSIEQGKGVKSIISTASISTSNQSLFDREIKSESLLNYWIKRYGDVGALHFCLHYQIGQLNGFIKEYINPNFEANISEEMTLRQLLDKKGELHVLASQTHDLNKLNLKFMNNYVYPKLNKKIKKNLSVLGGKEKTRNLMFVLFTFGEIFRKYYEFSSERNATLALNLNIAATDKSIQGFDLIIDKGISGLQKIVNDKYYSLFRVFLDLNTDIDKKAKIMLKYFCLLSDTECEKRSSVTLWENLNMLFSKVSNAACYVAKLQILIDLLTEMKKSPKTLDNVKLALAKCEECFNYYKEDAATYNQWCKEFACYASPYNQDYNSAKLYLKGLVDDLAQLKVAASWSTPISKGKRNQQRKNQKKVQPQQKQIKLTVIQSEKKQEKSPIASTEAVKVEELKENMISGEGLPVSEKEIVPKTHDSILAIDSEEDCLDDVERETNELFESIRQLIESDRKAKLELKELKATQKKQRAEEKVVIIEKKLEIVKLSSGHQTTLKAIFSEADCHLTLSGSAIENLINSLGGKAKAGSKKKINIFWGNSTKKAGSYEVTHGGDCDGCLTRDYLERVKKAILVGVDLGLIAKETISFDV